MSKFCFAITSLSLLSRKSLVSSLLSPAFSRRHPAFSHRYPAFPRRYPAFPRHYPAFPRRYYPSVPHLLLLSLATDSRTRYTTYLVQHSNPLVLDSDTWSAPTRNEQVTESIRSTTFMTPKTPFIQRATASEPYQG